MKNRMVDSYFRYMRNWDISAKKILIIRLTASLEGESVHKSDFSPCFGAWIDDRSSDDIIRDLKAGKNSNHEMEELL